MNQEQINRDLRERTSQDSEFQQKLLKLAQTFIKSSTDKMSSYYDRWDNTEHIYRGYRLNDREDNEKERKGEPSKIIVPVTYAQIQTAIAFLVGIYNQRSRFYELTPFGAEADFNVEPLETDLQYQLTRAAWPLRLYHFSLDSFKYGFGVIKADWKEERAKFRTRVPQAPVGIMANLGSMFGFKQEPVMVEQVQEVLNYQGNNLRNISPYFFYPDPSVNIANFQDGQFVAHDDDKARIELQKLEGTYYFGTNKISDKLPLEDSRNWNRRTGQGLLTESNKVPVGSGMKGPSLVVVTELQINLVPRSASKEYGLDLGDEDYPVKFLVVIANNEKIIKFERIGYLHDKFTYVVGESSPDNNSFYNPGLADSIYELQNIITFLLNSHVVNVRKIITNRFVADMSKFYEEDFNNNAMIIRLKQSGIPLDRILKQLEVTDVTSKHIGDIDNVMKIVQIVSGISENALGQFTTGRRSATEARNVSQGAAARLKMHASNFWYQAFEPLGRQLLSNTRQGRTKEVYAAIVGQVMAMKCPFERAILADPNHIAGGYDFVPYDATLPTEKITQANSLQELFGLLVGNPQAMQFLNLDPRKLLDHIAQLQGIKTLPNLGFDQQPVPPAQQQVSVLPDQQVGDMLAQAGGNAQPIDMNAALSALGGPQ